MEISREWQLPAFAAVSAIALPTCHGFNMTWDHRTIPFPIYIFIHHQDGSTVEIRRLNKI